MYNMMQGGCIHVSVVIPMYNAENYIEECITSVQKQSLKNIEIIVVDDMSTDGSLRIVKRIAQGDVRIHIVSTNKNSGAGFARNLGIKAAKGEYCIFMDADDFYYDNECLEFLYKKAKEREVVSVGGDKIDFDGRNKAFIKWSSIRYRNELLDAKEMDSVFWYTTYIFERKFLIENNILFPETRIFEDPIFFATVLNKMSSFYLTSKKIYVYRVLYKDKRLSLSDVENIFMATELIRDLLSDDYSIWKEQYLSIIKTLADGVIPFLFTKKGFFYFLYAQKIIRSFPERYKFKYNIVCLLGLAVLVKINHAFSEKLPAKYKKIIKKGYRVLYSK